VTWSGRRHSSVYNSSASLCCRRQNEPVTDGHHEAKHQQYRRNCYSLISTDPNATVAWSGTLEPELKTDISFKTFLGRGSAESIQILFRSEGFVVIQPQEEVYLRTVSEDLDMNGLRNSRIWGSVGSWVGRKACSFDFGIRPSGR
jgi:hypothetical protein